MQIQLESSFDFNRHMFQDIQVYQELHDVKEPELENDLIFANDESSSNQPFDKDENDDSKSQICQETRENTTIRKTSDQFIETTLRTKFCKNNHTPQKKQSQKASEKTKKISKEKQGSKKDYKKNICGYITRRVLKEALGTQYQQIIEQLCKDLDVPSPFFYRIYRAHNSQNITGPTHFYNLVNPRLGNDLEENVKEVSARMVFVLFFQWFVRNRYIRYLLGDGKMAQKDKYINYKNREMIFLIASEWVEMLQRAKDRLKESFMRVETVTMDFARVYSEMCQKNITKMSEQKEQEKGQYNREKVQRESSEKQKEWVGKIKGSGSQSGLQFEFEEIGI